MGELEKETLNPIDEVLDGFENDVTYEKTGNEGTGVKTLKNTTSAKDKSYDQGGTSTQHPTTGTMLTLPENVFILTKKTILEQIMQH